MNGAESLLPPHSSIQVLQSSDSRHTETEKESMNGVRSPHLVQGVHQLHFTPPPSYIVGKSVFSPLKLRWIRRA